MIFKQEDLQEIHLNKTSFGYTLEQETWLDCLWLRNIGANDLGHLKITINGLRIFPRLEINEKEIWILLNQEFEVKSFAIELLGDFSIKAYKRKKNLLIAGRADAFGSRMSAFVTAIYLAEKLGFKFGFVWSQLDKDKSGVFMESAEELFEREFLQKHNYSDVLPLRGAGNTLCFKTLQELQEKPCREVWGTWVMNYYIPTKANLADLNTSEYKESFYKIFSNLPMKPRYKEQIANARAKAALIGDFVALHMRSGDSIETQYRRFVFCPVIHKYFFPVDLVIFAARHFIKLGFKVLLFGADSKANEAVSKVLDDEVKSGNFINAQTWSENLNETQRTIFEVCLMAEAKKTIANHSTFSKFAAFLGSQNELLNFNVYFTQKELYNAFIVPKMKDYLDISNVQKSVSCAYAYSLGRQIGVSFEERIRLLWLALEFDMCNSAYRVMLVEEFLRQKQIYRAEKYLENVINERGEEYLASLLLVLWNTHIVFKEQFKAYLENAKEEFPYICFCAAKICFFNGNITQAKKIMDLARIKESQNEMFLSFIPFLKEADSKVAFLTAKHRIHNHLAYKLGSAMILNSKSLWGYIRMPYVLSFIKETHRKEIADYEARVAKNPSLKLPPLESYTDYKQALKEKECFTYKLGKALITTNSVRGGGRIFAYLQFFQEVRKLRGELKEKRK